MVCDRYGIGQLKEAKASYEAGLKLAPQDAALLDGMKSVQQAMDAPGPGVINPGDDPIKQVPLGPRTSPEDASVFDAVEGP